MSQAPTTGRTAMPVPSVAQLRGALATGGISVLRSWLRAFRASSGRDLHKALAVHATVLDAARRAHARYVTAVHTANAAQSDRLDPGTQRSLWQLVHQSYREAVCAAHLTQQSAQYIVALGGAHPAVDKALADLARHAGAEAALKSMPVRPVPQTDWYRR